MEHLAADDNHFQRSSAIERLLNDSRDCIVTSKASDDRWTDAKDATAENDLFSRCLEVALGLDNGTLTRSYLYDVSTVSRTGTSRSKSFLVNI